MAKRIGTIYLICFDRRYHHAAHYLGWTAGPLEGRIEAHRTNAGAKLMRAVNNAGITWTVTRTWRNRDRNYERSLKKRGGKARLCPRCKEAARA